MSETPLFTQEFMTPDEGQESSRLDRRERFKVIYENNGFYPQSNDEATHALAITGQSEQPYPVRNYLNEVAIRQYRVGADASAAIRSIVRRFADYAGNALNESSYAHSAMMSLANPGVNGRTGFHTIFPVEEWHEDRNMRASLKSLSRYVEINDFVEWDAADRLGKRELIDNMTSAQMTERIKEDLGRLRHSELVRISRSVIEMQESRFQYWIIALEGASQHFYAREVAQAALDELMQN